MNINVHMEGKNCTLEIIRVHESTTAEKCCVIVDKKLKEFGLHFACDIVAVTSDGADMMKNFGGSILPAHQLCLAHGSTWLSATFCIAI